MATLRRSAIVGVFQDRRQAQAAVNALRQAGFRDDQIGVAGRGHHTLVPEDSSAENPPHTQAGEGAVAGAALGVGAGALWGLGIMAGVLPALGPAVAGGTLATILCSAAAGATVAGIAGALIGMGIPKEEAEFYDGEFQNGRTIVSVNSLGREHEALKILRQFGGYDSNRQATGTPPPTSAPADHMAGASFSSTENQTGNVESGHRTLNVPIRRDDIKRRDESIRIPTQQDPM